MAPTPRGAGPPVVDPSPAVTLRTVLRHTCVGKGSAQSVQDRIDFHILSPALCWDDATCPQTTHSLVHRFAHRLAPSPARATTSTNVAAGADPDGVPVSAPRLVRRNCLHPAQQTQPGLRVLRQPDTGLDHGPAPSTGGRAHGRRQEAPGSRPDRGWLGRSGSVGVSAVLARFRILVSLRLTCGDGDPLERSDPSRGPDDFAGSCSPMRWSSSRWPASTSGG